MMDGRIWALAEIVERANSEGIEKIDHLALKLQISFQNKE